jgi:anti-sigma regulatory factor (Ser/Thr protein kinase)
VQELRIRLAADPVSVPGARRFVTDGLRSWQLDSLADDAELCVSELAGNAALHSASTFMVVTLHRSESAVRVTVEDDGATPAAAVQPRLGFPGPHDQIAAEDVDDESTTGRGLAIVSILARDWGVEQTAEGKRVWAELTDDSEEHRVRPPSGTVAEPAAPDALPPGWTLVRLVSCPVGLSLQQDRHLDELVRELQLLQGAAGERSQALVRRLEGLLSGPAHARHTGRRAAQQAAAAGLEHIDVEMAVPHEVSLAVVELQRTVAAADELCAEARLLTLASTPEVTALRAWMTEEIRAQVSGAQPVPWPEWLSRRETVGRAELSGDGLGSDGP